MMPNAVKGSDIRKLMWYLAGPGKANEHTNPTVIAGDIVTMAVYGGAIDPRRAWELGNLLDSPRQTVLRGEPVLTTSYKQARALMAEGMSRKEAFEAATKDENTWHCSLALRAEEGQLPLTKWAQIATDFMREMGYIDRDDVPDARWAVVHHGLSKSGNDHVHIAMPVVRPDGSLADMFRDRVRAQAAARVLEERYGLEVLYTREHGDTERATRPAERARAERVAALETDREALRRRVRGAAVAADSEAEWLRLLHVEGVTVIPRYARGSMDAVEGYSVQMQPQLNKVTGRWEKSLSYSGLRLGKDLTLPALRHWAGWDRSAAAAEDARQEWSRIQPGRPRSVSPMAEREAIDELARWSDEMRRIPVGDRDAWAAAASRTAGLFAAASVRTEPKPGPLDRLHRQLARAGQLPAHRRARQPERDTRGRAVARMLWAAANPAAADMALLYALTDLLLAVRGMLDATERATAAAAMASTARRALTEIHMRADGIDPARPYRKEQGSPAWAAAARASIVVDRLPREETEEEIAAFARGWRTRRLVAVATGDGEQYDEKGHILDQPGADSRRAAGRAAVRRGIDDVLGAAQGPLTAPTEQPRGRPRRDIDPPRPHRGPEPPTRDRGRGTGR